jgi:hypothetical protein
MPGGTLQLSKYNNNPIDFTLKNPDITFFKSVFKRYSHFSNDNVEVYFNKEPELSFDKPIIMTSKLDKIGHLLNDVYLAINIPNIHNINSIQCIDDFGVNILDNVSIQIGNETIHEFDSDWINIYYNRYISNEKYREIKSMINPAISNNKNIFLFNQQTLYVWLPFFFSRDPSLGIPLYNLEYHAIYINIKLKPIRSWFTILENNLRIPIRYLSDIKINTNETFKFNLNINISFFDKSLLKLITLNRYENLIEQVHTIHIRGIYKKNIKIPIYSKKAIKEFFIIAYREDNIKRNTHNNYSNYENIKKSGDLSMPINYLTSEYNTIDYLKQLYYQKTIEFVPNIIDDIQLYIEDKPRFHVLKSNYLRLVQSYQNNMNFQENNNYIYYYSFSINPIEIQPSGTLNLGRIAKTDFDINLSMTPPVKPINTNLLDINSNINLDIDDNNNNYAWTYSLKIFLINYNVLKIFGGMADIQFKK